MDKMFNTVLKEGLSFGEAMHEAIVNDEFVARAHWGGFWYNEHPTQPDVDLFTQPVLVAVLKDGMNIVPATPYNEDIQSRDWMIVANVTFPEL